MRTARHWDDVYAARASEELGWHESQPSTVGLVLRFSAPSAAVIDVGAGDSRLVDELLAAGYDAVTLLDLSATALERVRSRLGPNARRITSIEADVTHWCPPRRWNLWHDRAVFHFLIDAADRRAYKATALEALEDDGHLIVASFASDGPDRCAGLPVVRYDIEGLAAEFGPELELVEHLEWRPAADRAGDRRPYVIAVLRRARLGTNRPVRAGAVAGST